MISASPSDCRRRGIRSISGAQASSGATATARTGRPSRSTFAARGACVTTTTSFPARTHARASGTSGSRCPEWPVVENRTRTRPVAHHVGGPRGNARGRPAIVASCRPASRRDSAPGRACSRRSTAGRCAARRSRSPRCGRARARSWSRSPSWRSARAASPRSAPSRRSAWRPRRCSRRSSRRWPTGSAGSRSCSASASSAARCSAGAAVVTADDGPPAATYGFAVVATVAVSLYRPAHSALLPALAKSPQDLTSANAVRGMLDSLATLGGPVAAAVLLAASGPAAVFAACAAASLLGGLVVVALAVRRAAAGRGRARRPAVRPPGLHDHRGRSHAVADHRARGRADVHARMPDRVRRRHRDRPARHGRPGRRGPERRRSAPAASSARSSRSGWSGAAGSPRGSGSGSRCSARRWR